MSKQEEVEQVEQFEQFDVTEYENLAALFKGVSDWGSDWNNRQSLMGAAQSIEELCREIRRLHGGT